jgi:uncharacterized delta-60 repeat protein
VAEPLEERALLTAGVLDPTFGMGGLVSTDFHSVGRAVAIDQSGGATNGDIVVAGDATDPVTGMKDFVVARYLPSGQLDTSFGMSGEVLTSFSGRLGRGNATGRAVAVLGDSRIVVAGYAEDVNPKDRNFGTAFYGGPNHDFAIARYNSDGTLDTSFGTGGRVVFDFTTQFANHPGDALLNGLAIDSQNRIVVAGQAYDSAAALPDFALARLDSQGNLDAHFGANNSGLVVTNISANLGFAQSFCGAEAVALQNDGGIVLAGYAADASGGPSNMLNEFALARYTAGGQLDSSFNGRGVSLTAISPGSSSSANAVAVAPDNSIVAAGFAVDPASGNFAFGLARYMASGQLDRSFNGSGTVLTPLGSQAEANAVAVQPDGKIVAAGDTSSALNAPPTFAVARYNADGTLDPTFDPNGSQPGVVTTSFFGQGDQALAMALQPDGAIVVAGTATQANGDASFGVARYLAPTVQISPPTPVVEGLIAIVTITRSDTTGPADVTFSTSDATARAGTDYAPVNQTVHFANGQASATVLVHTLDDNTDPDGPKTVNLTLSNPSGVGLGAQSTAVLTIQGPGPGSQVQFALPSFAVGENGGSISVPIIRTGDTSAAGSVTVAVTGGSAVPGVDFQIVNPTVQFAAEQTTPALLTIRILNDGVFDGNQTVKLALTAPSNLTLGTQSTAGLTINETNPQPPPPSPFAPPIAARLVRRIIRHRSRLVVVLFYANTGSVVAGFVSPLQPPGVTNIRVSVVQPNPVGVPLRVILTGRQGPRNVRVVVLV